MTEGSDSLQPGNTVGEFSAFNPYAMTTATFYQTLAKARETEPIFYSDVLGSWVATRYDDVVRITQDPETFSSRSVFPKPTGLPGAAQDAMDFLFAKSVLVLGDPPEHGPVRRIVHEGFRPRAVAAFEPQARALIAGKVDRLPDGRFDLVSGLAFETTLAVLMRFMGIPADRYEFVREWRESSQMLLLGSAGLDTDRLLALGETYMRGVEYFVALSEERRAAPGDDFMSLMTGTEIGGRRLDDEEVVGQVVSLFGAGTESTANSLVNIVLALLEEPGRWDRLVRGDVDADRAATEGLRYDIPGFGVFRAVTRDTCFGDVAFRAGDLVLLSFAAANHDPKYFSDPDEFRLDRPVRADLTYGYGIHNCVGAAIAKLTLTLTLTALVRRFPRLRLVADQEMTYQPYSLSRVLAALWLDGNPC